MEDHAFSQATTWAETRTIAQLTEARLFETGHPSPQPFLWNVGDVERLLVRRLDPYLPRRAHDALAQQEPLLSLDRDETSAPT